MISLVTQYFSGNRDGRCMTTLETDYRAWREKNVSIPDLVAWTDIGMASATKEEPAPPPVKARRGGWRVHETIRRAKKGSNE